MNAGRTILRVDATYPLEVKDGDTVRRGQRLQRVPDTDEPIVAPVSGTIESIQFDPDSHELVITIDMTAR